tara:strand:+ start:206 stop:709 length:504 start_codon:yes stop_codon:yes gene_type:complete
VQKKILYSFFLFFYFFNINVNSETILGKPKIIDGDSLHINSKKIRLLGVDAPEINQKCKKIYLSILIFNFQKEYYCGKYVTDKLKDFIKNNEVSCEIYGKDRYKRYLAVCYLKNKDINSWLVKNGLAIAYKKYSKQYLSEENFAKKNFLGIWAGSFKEPEKWRRENK